MDERVAYRTVHETGESPFLQDAYSISHEVLWAELSLTSRILDACNIELSSAADHDLRSRFLTGRCP